MAIAPASHAASTVMVLGVGSAVPWEMGAVATWATLAGNGARHYTFACSSNSCVQMVDQRASYITPVKGKVWIVWSADQSKVWAHLATDTVAGVRGFFAAPRATLQLPASVETSPGQNQIPVSLWGADAASLPATIYNALNGAAFNAAFSSLRPEDAEFAQQNAVQQLGYGNSASGPPICSHYSSMCDQAVAFHLHGHDPISGQPLPAWTTVNIGATPLVFLINRMNPQGLGSPGVFTNLDDSHAAHIFDGGDTGVGGCDTNAFGAANPPPDVPLTVVLREPLSSEMNTAQYTIFADSIGQSSQEAGIPFAPAAGTIYNPLDAPCALGGGVRTRALTSPEVDKNAIQSTVDSVAYDWFNYGDFVPIAGSANWGYLAIDGVDPIQAAYTNGNLPVCAYPCPTAPGASFPNLRNGTYKSWNVSLVATAASGVHLTNAQSMVTAMQNTVNSLIPDFVPAVAANGDPGLQYYRSHYAQAGYPPNNGLGGQKESGGDVGGCIEPIGPPPGVLNCRE